MEELTRSQQGRVAIRNFETITNALTIRGSYRLNGQSGRAVKQALRTLSPEIYGAMNDPRRIELNGLEYVLDRLPRGIEKCRRIVLTAQEEFENTPFEPIQPPKRRRLSYMVSEREICFVITRGLSEIYDIVSHLTFLNIEARKIYQRMTADNGERSAGWRTLQTHVEKGLELNENELDQAIWDLSILIGRKFQETRDAYLSLEKSRKEHRANNGLFHIIYSLGERVADEETDKDNSLAVYFTPALQELVGHHPYAERWAEAIKSKLVELGLADRPLHLISANMHSVVNTLYAHGAVGKGKRPRKEKEYYDFFAQIRGKDEEVKAYAARHGFHDLPDHSGTQIHCQIIDTEKLAGVRFHPELGVSLNGPGAEPPVLLVMDYAFGVQAFLVVDKLLDPDCSGSECLALNLRSISVMGKAGILPGSKGDIMLATAFVIEGTTDNYIVDNELSMEDFPPDVSTYAGPMLTVLGTSLQNKYVLERFKNSTWQAVGLEMEGAHYQRAISAAMVRGHVPGDARIRYAYYASDNPLQSGETLASGSMGEEGIRPTYMITKVILEKIFCG